MSFRPGSNRTGCYGNSCGRNRQHCRGDEESAVYSGRQKLTYTQFDMPLTAIDDFAKLGERDPLFKKLDECCKAHKGLWCAEAEKVLFEHFGVK